MLRERFLCLHCLSDLPETHFAQLGRNPMADRFNGVMSRHIPHGVEVPYLHAAALFFYDSESGYRKIPQALKYRAALRLGRHFARMLGKRLACSEIFKDTDAVIPVPLHWTRALKRGYNQAEVIASEVAAALGAPMVPGVLRRRRRTRSQTHVAVDEKAANVSGAFALRKCSGVLPYRHVLLVDDTFTTGATLAECAATLLPALPPQSRISVATLAYVGH